MAILGSRGFPSTYGGFETFVRRLAPWLVEAGLDVSVYSRDRLTWTSEDAEGVRRIITPGIDRKSISTLTYGATASIDSLFRGFDACLVLNVANGFYLPLLRRRGLPTAVNVDGLEWQRAKWSPLGRAVFRRGAAATARFADEIVVDSEAIGDAWRDLFGRSSRFIPYGGDVLGPRSDERVRALGLEPGSYVLIVARLVPENNIDLLLDAVEGLGADTPVVLVGSANYRSDIEQRVERTAATRKSFLALGHVHDQELLSDLWSHCGVYLHGHSVGGTNPALLQALGAGSPTLALDTVYNREVIRADDQLFPSDPGALAARVQTVLNDGAYQAELSRRGPAIIAERYDWDDVCAAYLRVLEDVAERRAGGRA